MGEKKKSTSRKAIRQLASGVTGPFNWIYQPVHGSERSDDHIGLLDGIHDVEGRTSSIYTIDSEILTVLV